jgi:hypothetical protein
MKNMDALTGISSKTSESTSATSSSIAKLAELASQLHLAVSGFTLPEQAAAAGMLTQTLARPHAAAAAGEDEPLPRVAEPRRRSG